VVSGGGLHEGERISGRDRCPRVRIRLGEREAASERCAGRHEIASVARDEPEHAVRGTAAGVVGDRDTRRHRYSNLAAIRAGHGNLRNQGADLICDHDRCVDRDVFKQQDEFLATIAGDDVRRTETVRQDGSELTQDRIPRLMTMLIVDRTEAVEIEEDSA